MTLDCRREEIEGQKICQEIFRTWTDNLWDVANHRWSDVGILGNNVCSFVTGMTLQLQILLPKFCDLYENLKCAMCKSVKVGFPSPAEDLLTDLCICIHDCIQFLSFLHLVSGCNHECRCKECLAKDEVSPAPPRMPTPPQKSLQRTSETSCNSVQLRSPLRPQ